MALSFEESKKLLKQQAAETPAVMSLHHSDSGIMTLDAPQTDGLIAAYSEWTKSAKYTWYDQYSDEAVSRIDKNKNITIDASQINISQEENSQFIPFEMPRYYDGFDLMETTIWIHYLSSDGYRGASKAVNVSYDATTIKFGWLIDGKVTHIAGNLKIEIRAIGVNNHGDSYVWKSKTFDQISVLQSLFDDNETIVLDDSWVQELITSIVENVTAEIAELQVAEHLEAAETAAKNAQDAASTAQAYANDASQAAITAVNGVLANYATKSYVDDAIDKVDLSDKLQDYALKSEIPVNVSELENDVGYLTEHQSLDAYALKTDVPSIEGLATETYVDEAVRAVDVSDQLKDYAKSADVYTKSEIDEAISNVEVDLSGYYTKSEVDAKDDALSSSISTNTGSISSLNKTVAEINQTLASVDKSPRVTYEATYGDVEMDDGSKAEYMFTLWETEGANEPTVKSRFQIMGGGGGSGSNVALRIAYVEGYTTPITATVNDKAIIKYEFSGEDSAGDTNLDGIASWKVGNRVVAKQDVATGIREFDITDYVSVGDNKVVLTITHATGSVATKAWTIKVVDVRLTSSFDDTKVNKAGSAVNFTFTPYGGIEKTVHFLLDGKEIDTKKSVAAAAGLSDSYSIPAQGHGTHLFEVYMTAEINNNTVESNHIVKDVIWYDDTSDIPVIGCVQQEFTARQYETVNIIYTVYDPSTDTPNVSLKSAYVNSDGEIVEEYSSNKVMELNTDTWQYKTDVIGEHTLTITCGETVKILKANITEIGIEVSPTVAGLEFDFNPVGYSNNDKNRMWVDKNTGVTMTVSDNFDWVNGGYQIDDNGDQYFCVKAGTTATINYNLFADDAKANGKEFKAIFKTSNVKKRDVSFISCMNSGIGIDMRVESANIYSSNGNLYSPYCEDDVIEFEFNINKSADIPMVMTYEDGVGNRPMIYTSDSSFWQTSPQPITIGCDGCDVYIYRMKAYSTSLSDRDILNNFIADARSAEEMIDRYTRNQIYQDGILTPEHLAEVCPDLRIIMIDAPWFTNDKDNKIDDTNVTMIYKNGDPILDNWTCTGARHRGQGTSSNEYGYASRNIDLVMDTDTSLFTLGDGITTSSTITLTRDSVPTDYLNVKVNVASSENQNNAQHARRYNQFNPFVRFAKFKDSKVKDCMEFYNCVVFIKERDTDISTHREFLDTNWHFYSLGNVGDSKKTDDTRVNNKRDPKECVVEITDYNVPLAEFPTGNGKDVCPVEDWKAGNVAYDYLYADYEYEDGEFKSFGKESYEFRYEMKDITEEQRQVNIDTWREFYKFVVTSTEAEFYTRLKEYFVIDSALYYYLYTERYTMVDNRAKNSFWHYGKVYISTSEAATLGEDANGYIIDDDQAALHEGYRWDLSFGYDFDTSLGIDNTGKLVLTYGKEDADYYVDGDPSSSYIYRAAESNFFCRIRDLFASELQAMFVDRENVNAWSASGLVKQWDDAQSQFPEEVWRLDIQRKYFRTYQGISIDNSKPGEANPRFLVEMMNGRKKYQRRMFERNQELYMATKYFGKVATQDQIMMRFNNPVGAVIKPDFTLYLTPYSDMYIGVKFGNVSPVNFRAKAGVKYTIPYSIAADTADITLIYGASFIQEIGDLSKCYVGDNDFSKASRLQSLSIGSNVSGYQNNFMTKISLGNNKLLEYLDIRNIPSLNSVVDLSQCANMIELHAEGSGITGVIFANGGKIAKAYIPAITSLTMKNLHYLEEFVVENYNKLQTLIVEYTPFINTYAVVSASPLLSVLRLIGIDWDIENTDILDRVLKMRGVNNIGGEITTSVLAGDVYVPIIRQKQKYDYQNAWPDLKIDAGTTIEQFTVTFVNYDGTVLDVQYVDKGTKAVDPLTRENNPISTPTKASTISTDYAFAGWDKVLVDAFENQVITATYSESTRKYSVKYMSKNTVLQEGMYDYGSIVTYNGQLPTYTLEESAYKYYLFNGWDQGGYVSGNKTINATYDSCEYREGYFNDKDIGDMRPVELYMMMKLGASGVISIANYVTAKDTITMQLGNDFSYQDVEENVLISEKTVFTGSNYVDTGIQLLLEDRDFVLAIDCEMSNVNTSNAVLAQCFSGLDTSGFKIFYNNGVKLSWGSSSTSSFKTNNREMIVIRHVKGDNGLHVYSSNVTGISSYYVKLEGVHSMAHDVSLVFGCNKLEDGSYEQHANGVVYWSKLWYADLGDDICYKIAYWPHEEMKFEACCEKNGSLKRYYLSDNSGARSSITFIASNALSQPVIMDNSSVNAGGWAEYALNEYLNSRVYKAFPDEWKQLMKQVKVKSSIGSQSTDISSSDCYIFVPAISELDPSLTTEPYASEGTAISHFSGNSSRICYTLNGNAVQYWTRSPSMGWPNYVYRISSAGSTQAVTQLNMSDVYARIMISM